MRGLLAHLHSSELVARFQTTCGLYPAAEENSFHSGCHHLNEHALSNGNVGVVHRHRGEEGTEKLNGVTREQDNNSNYTGPGIKGLKVRLWFYLIGDLLYKYFCFLLWPIPRKLCEGRPSRRAHTLPTGFSSFTSCCQELSPEKSVPQSECLSDSGIVHQGQFLHFTRIPSMLNM